MLQAIRASGGAAVAVTDREMIEAAGLIASREGIDACPEGGAALAAVRRLAQAGAIGTDKTMVIFNTGTGLKYST